MNKKLKTTSLSLLLALPLLFSSNVSATEKINKDEPPKYETSGLYVSPLTTLDYGKSDYWAYNKRAFYTQNNPNFPKTKYYTEFNDKYEKWFSGNLYFESYYWDANQGVYVGWYKGEIKR